MTHVYRISTTTEVGHVVHAVESLEAFARWNAPGRPDVDEHSLVAFPGSNAVPRAWGKVICDKDG